MERFGVAAAGEGDAPGFLWVEAGDVGRCPGVHGWSHLKDDPAHNVSRATAEKRCAG